MAAFNESAVRRHAAGTAAGGQFAAKQRSESDAVLDAWKPGTSPARLLEIARSGNPGTRAMALLNKSFPAENRTEFLDDPSLNVRYAVATHTTEPGHLTRLMCDEDKDVREKALERTLELEEYPALVAAFEQDRRVLDGYGERLSDQGARVPRAVIDANIDFAIAQAVENADSPAQALRSLEALDSVEKLVVDNLIGWRSREGEYAETRLVDAVRKAKTTVRRRQRAAAKKSTQS